MSHSWVRGLSSKKRSICSGFGLLRGTTYLPFQRFTNCPLPNISSGAAVPFNFSSCYRGARMTTDVGQLWTRAWVSDFASGNVESVDLVRSNKNIAKSLPLKGFKKKKVPIEKLKASTKYDYTKVDVHRLPTVILVGRPNVGKSVLFNRLIGRREALVYNTPEDHVTRDIREGVASLGDLRFQVLDSAGLEMAATSGSILHRTAGLTANVLARAQAAVFLIDLRLGLHPLDAAVAKWMRKNAPRLPTILVMNKAEELANGVTRFAEIVGEAFELGYGDPIAISAETGLGMVELYSTLRPVLDGYMLKLKGDASEKSLSREKTSSIDSSEMASDLQLAIVGRPNVGKSTLLNALVQEERVLVGPEAGLTRDSIRVQFQFEGRTVYLVDTAGWLRSTKEVKGPSCLGVMQAKRSLTRAQIVALVLDAEEIADKKKSMNHAEIIIARKAMEEGRGLVVVVNKMDLVRGEQYKQVTEIVPQEIQTCIPEVSEIPTVFVSALEGKGRLAVMREVVKTYEKWCKRISTGHLNRWLIKVMSRHSWKDAATQPKVKYFTQVKARPPTFLAFTGSRTVLADTELRFIKKSLVEDFGVGGIPIRVMQRAAPRRVRRRRTTARRQTLRSSRPGKKWPREEPSERAATS